MTRSRTLVPTADGTTLGSLVIPGNEHCIVALHGFTGSLDDMAPLVEQVRGDRTAILVDLIGHGASDSPESVEPYRMASVVDQVLSLIGHRNPGSVHLVGYSMGGRIVLSMAARAPWYFASVTTLSATAGIEDPSERAARYDRDYALADRIESIGVPDFISEWLDLPLFKHHVDGLGAKDRAELRRRRNTNSSKGLSNSLRGTGTGSMTPVWDRLSALRTPMLAIAGSRDPKYAALADRLAEVAPDGRAHIVEAGHVVHLEIPDPVASVVAAFLESCEQRQSQAPSS